MPRTIIALISLILIAAAAIGQDNLRFDAADVHATPHTNAVNVYMTGGIVRNGRYDLRKATMLDLIATAWHVDPDTVVGGPAWLNWDRFDIAAKAPDRTPPETLRLMLQRLLEERFQLVVRNESRPMPAYVLAVGKGKPKLKEASAGAERGCRGVPQETGPNSYAVVACHSESMEAFARELRDMAGDYLTSPVFDATDLKGEWDFEFKWTGRYQLPAAGSDGIPLFDALDKQLGLKLDFRKAPAPALVVESVNETPLPNPPNTAEALPPPPPMEFDVAEVKLSPPDVQPNARILPGGRIDAQGMTMKFLINFAWDINTDEQVTGGPKWWDSTRYTLTAQSTSATGPRDQQVDSDDLRLMLQHLLAERFKLATHMEDHPLNTYTLVSVKPKLTKADPSNRTGCKEAATQEKDPRNTSPALQRLLVCTNVTMDQFASQLQPMASGYLRLPVKNDTGIEGAYDIQLSFSTAGFLRNAGRQQPGTDAGAADPSGGISLFDAVSKTLGLKIEQQKRPMPVLVIDHVEEKPLEN